MAYDLFATGRVRDFQCKWLGPPTDTQGAES